jgi:hypothetical protein
MGQCVLYAFENVETLEDLYLSGFYKQTQPAGRNIKGQKLKIPKRFVTLASSSIEAL